MVTNITRATRPWNVSLSFPHLTVPNANGGRIIAEEAKADSISAITDRIQRPVNSSLAVKLGDSAADPNAYSGWR
ncbi:hypothetical protein HPP92_014825 [Vanilla planifolia]|uniref:Uncharacterized protein n=1 Tax=Vanilla planifolia TaxID=51239 RepID=A0A835QQV0_VANPL|nr:hypothetical protein HPP92_014825 [Vanilla planifolia]